MSNSSLIKLQHFFEVDKKIKQEIYNSVPPFDDGFVDDQSLCNYIDDLEDSLIYIFNELKCISLDIFGNKSVFLSFIEKFESLLKEKFYSCGLDINKLRSFYKSYISDIDARFVDEVKNNCVGYTISRSLPIDRVRSINELLHLMHASISNNENILQSIPSINQKYNCNNSPITLRGEATQLSSQLIEQFPYMLDVGVTDIISLNEKKILLMIRDRGHALTIEITINNDKARIEYFIPKIINIDMINALPGVNKVRENSVGATGVIEVNKDILNDTLFYFISKVPTDRDLDLPVISI